MMDIENYHIQVYLLSIQHKKSTHYKLVVSPQMTPKVNYFGVFELKPGVKSTPKNNLQVAYYFKTFFMLDEWEVCSHEYDSSLSLSLSIHDV